MAARKKDYVSGIGRGDTWRFIGECVDVGGQLLCVGVFHCGRKSKFLGFVLFRDERRSDWVNQVPKQRAQPGVVNGKQVDLGWKSWSVRRASGKECLRRHVISRFALSWYHSWAALTKGALGGSRRGCEPEIK